MKTTPAILLLALLILFTGCDPYEDDGHFYVERDGATMPVWVAGNEDSRDCIVFVNGGPGSTSYLFETISSCKKLGKKYRMVYYDQRGCGLSSGNPPESSYTLSSFAKDLDLVIDTVDTLYPVKRFYLAGYSFGGMVSTNYLLKKQKKITGYIHIDGAHDMKNGMKLSRQWIMDYIENKLTQNLTASDRSYWETAEKFYDENATITIDNQIQHATYVDKANGFWRDTDKKEDAMEKYYGALSFSSEMNPITKWLNQYNVVKKLDIYDKDFTERLGEITIPVCVIWGKYDGILPVALASEAYDNFGAAADKKELVIFDDSAHNVMEEEGGAFYQTVRDFIENTKS